MPGERRFFTRACAKKKARDALYEDLFSSVVEKAFLTPVEQEDLSCDEAPINGPLKRKKTKGLTCQCGSLFEKHAQLHEHIVSEHGNDDFVSCKECGIRREAIHRNNVCHICELFRSQLG
ncbi:unnamed protein product [Caenorhabditis auriculariae]|uniref:C2H2-type domain-containing protein n=1 Tax=Caenorhabditis auriculariae TaxID=2777116 RepID=A0A8S1GY01_9PELO|nr:unnamed protein product [Caenorhabditis auriculariae]